MSKRPTIADVVLALIATVLFGSSAVLALSDSATPRHRDTCARERPGGYELVSFKLNPGGDERECRYVKHGVR